MGKYVSVAIDGPAGAGKSTMTASRPSEKANARAYCPYLKAFWNFFP